MQQEQEQLKQVIRGQFKQNPKQISAEISDDEDDIQ